MQPRNIILLASSGIVLLAFLALVFAARGPREVRVDEQELAQAVAAHNQVQSARPRAASTQKRSMSATTPRARAPVEEPAETGDQVPPPPPRDWSAMSPPEETEQSDGSLNSQMDAANKLYDKGDYEPALHAAIEILESHPKVVRMLRIAVSASCIMGEEEQARRYYQDLPPRDQAQMARRCQRYGVEFESPPQ